MIKKVQRLLIPPKCVFTSIGVLLNNRLELIDPGWHYNQEQDWIYVKSRRLREPTTSKDVLVALDLEQMDKQRSTPSTG